MSNTEIIILPLTNNLFFSIPVLNLKPVFRDCLSGSHSEMNIGR